MTDNKLHGGGDGDPEQFSEPVPLNLENHCLFCLQPQQAKTLLKVARKNPKLRTNPSPIIRYLTGTDRSWGRSDEEYESMMGVPITTRFPSMTCAACYNILEELCKLHEKLLEVQGMIQKEAELARELIIKSQEVSSSSTVSSRQEFYSKIQSSKMPEEEIRTVAMLVDNFHSALVFKASANHNAELPSGSDLVSNTVDHASAPDHSKHNVGDFEMMKLQCSKTNVKRKDEKEDADNDSEDLLEEFNDFGESSNSRNYAEAGYSPSECDLGNRNLGDGPSSADESCSSSSSYNPLPNKKKQQKKGQNKRTIIGKSQYCDICGELYRFPELRTHLETTHNVQDFITKCPNRSCPYIFSCRGKMERHLRSRSFFRCQNIANLPKIFRKCEICNLDIYKTKYVNHIKTHELQMHDKILSCPIPGCSDQYALRQSLEVHLLIHDGRISKRSKEQECSICKQLLKVGNVKNHLQEVHEVEEVISCRRCPFLFHNWESLLDHLEKHGLTKLKGCSGQFVCGICNDGVEFRDYESFRQHFFNVHNIGNNFCCEFCGNEFFAQTTLSLHKQKCSSDKPSTVAPKVPKPKKKYFVCDQCPDSSFQMKASLQSHKIKEHGAGPVACRFCGDSFQSPYKLVKHEREHLGLVNTYKCKVESCGKTYRQMVSLKRHELTAHTDNPSFKLVVCDICGKGYKSRAGLNDHMKKVHYKIKEPRRICEVCGESFSCVATLRRHNLIHTGARPHQCPICGQPFRHREVLKTHIKSHLEKGDSFKPNGPMKNIRKRL